MKRHGFICLYRLIVRIVPARGQAFPNGVELCPSRTNWFFVPLFGTKTQNAAATAFYIVRDIAPNRINEYMRLAYGETTNRRVTPDIYVGILRSMGFSQAQINASLNSKNTQSRIARAIDLSRRYRVSVTPSFGVVGKYTTHAGFTNGDYSLLTQLLNGLVSDAMEKNLNPYRCLGFLDNSRHYVWFSA